MCLLLIAIEVAPDCPLLLLGNRDEQHARASATAQPWADAPHVVGGRDLLAGGSWLAVRDNGRFAAVTNLRTTARPSAVRSRGWLVRDFVRGQAAPTAFLEIVRERSDDYGPFNLIVGDASGVHALGSDEREIRALRRGVHVISNGTIGARWPKTERLQNLFVALMHAPASARSEARQLDLLRDEVQPADDALPDTGVGLELERRLAPIFLRGEHYGTRAATLVARQADGRWVLRERSFGPNATLVAEVRWQARAESGFQSTPCSD